MKEKGAYFIIYDWMVDIGLSSNDLNLYALIFSFTSEGNFWMASRSYLAKRIGCSVITVYKSIQFLQDNGLLEKMEVMKGNVLSVEYRAIKKLNPIKKLNNPIKKINRSPIKKLNTNNKEDNNIIINSTTTNNAHAHDRLQQEIDELKNDMIWLEPICMNHKIKLSELDSLFDAFKLECQCNAVTEHISIEDAKKHFNNWLRKRNDYGTNSNSKQQGSGYVRQPTPSENIEAARAEQVRRMAELDSKAEKPTFDVFPKL